VNKRPNPLIGWQVDPTAIRTIGHDLSRPECILAEPDGSLWTADGRGGVMHIRPDGNQQLIIPTANSLPNTLPTAGSFPTASNLPDGRSTMGRNLTEVSLPNGLAFAHNGDLLIANFGTDVLEVMTRDGRRRAVYDNIDGMPLGKVNFVLRDSRDRIWITVSTRTNPWSEAICSRLADGYIAVLDEGGLRVVADGFVFTNEIRLDAKEEWLYVAETCARRVSRLRVAADGSLHDREVYGPSSLGSGAVDGIAFDAYGNLWAAMIFADKLVAITPDGDLLTLFDDGDHAAAARFDAELDSGRVVNVATMSATGGKIAPWLTSITFGGPDLRTVYLGSVKGNTIPYFNSPVPGLPMVHWGGSTSSAK
jgi:gluconolactonase